LIIKNTNKEVNSILDNYDSCVFSETSSAAYYTAYGKLYKDRMAEIRADMNG